jgi:hypothetical protein
MSFLWRSALGFDNPAGWILDASADAQQQYAEQERKRREEDERRRQEALDKQNEKRYDGDIR